MVAALVAADDVPVLQGHRQPGYKAASAVAADAGPSWVRGSEGCDFFRVLYQKRCAVEKSSSVKHHGIFANLLNKLGFLFHQLDDLAQVVDLFFGKLELAKVFCVFL